MAQTRFTDSGKFKGDRVEAIILRRATPRISGGGTDYDEEVNRREDRFFKDLDLTNITSKEDFELEFEIAKGKIPLTRPLKRSTMPTKTADNFEKFKDAMWRHVVKKDLFSNIKRLKPRDIGLKSGKKVKGFATPLTKSGEMRFVTLENTNRFDEKGNPIKTIRVRDNKGRIVKKSDVFDKF